MDFFQAVNRFRQGETSNPDTNSGITADISREINVQFVTNSSAPHVGGPVGSIRLLDHLPFAARLSTLSGRATDADITNKDPVRPSNQPRDIRLLATTKGAVQPSGCSRCLVRDGSLRTPDSRGIGGRRRIENLLAGRHTRGTDGNARWSRIASVYVRDSLRTKRAGLSGGAGHRVVSSF